MKNKPESRITEKLIYILLGTLFLSSLTFAITEATVAGTAVTDRWSGNTADSYTTEGGNITGLNISVGQLTERWAAYSGNVSGSIVLRGSGSADYVYNWSWAVADGGSVCLTQDNSFPWHLGEATTAADIDTAFSFGSGADQAADTYTDTNCSIQTFEMASIRTTSTYLMGYSTFENCVIGDSTEVAEGDFAFCTNITSSGKNWRNETINYEIMVPTTDTATATEIYYLFAELH
ncbi:MAG: hypothetical protein ABII39_04510 [Candidatus Micrarchaeota archaeon]